MMRYNIITHNNDGSGINEKNLSRDEMKVILDRILQDLWNHENVRITLEREDSD